MWFTALHSQPSVGVPAPRLTRWELNAGPPGAPGAAATPPLRGIAVPGVTLTRHADGGAPRWHIRLLDGAQLRLLDQPGITLPRGKTGTLLRWLAVQQRRSVARTRLMAQLWPEADPAAARNNLNVAVHRLRRLLGDETLIVCRDEGYAISEAADVWIDVEAVEAALDRGAQHDAAGRADLAQRAWETAIGLYQHDLVDDTDFAQPLRLYSQALCGRIAAALSRLQQLHELRGDWHSCLRVALRQVEIDQCSEAAHRQAMRCYAHLGQPLLAERQFRHCCAALREQLGLAPGAETVGLYRQITRLETV